MNSTAQHSLSPLVQYNQVISSCFLYSIYGKKSAFVRGLNKSCIMYLKSASNLNGNLNCSKELEHYAS